MLWFAECCLIWLKISDSQQGGGTSATSTTRFQLIYNSKKWSQEIWCSTQLPTTMIHGSLRNTTWCMWRSSMEARQGRHQLERDGREEWCRSLTHINSNRQPTTISNSTTRVSIHGWKGFASKFGSFVRSFCPEHSWKISSLEWMPGKKSIFATEEEEDEDMFAPAGMEVT